MFKGPDIAYSARLTQVWLEHSFEAFLVGQRVLLGTASPRELRELRVRWFSELSRAADDYLRSPAFLELMGLSLVAMSKSMRLVRPLRARRIGAFL